LEVVVSGNISFVVLGGGKEEAVDGEVSDNWVDQETGNSEETTDR
jgi:hypothetical protein